jgi:hypothetical protein
MSRHREQNNLDVKEAIARSSGAQKAGFAFRSASIRHFNGGEPDRMPRRVWIAGRKSVTGRRASGRAQRLAEGRLPTAREPTNS